MTDPTTAAALILDEFTNGAYWGERHTSIRHGLPLPSEEVKP